MDEKSIEINEKWYGKHGTCCQTLFDASHSIPTARHRFPRLRVGEKKIREISVAVGEMPLEKKKKAAFYFEDEINSYKSNTEQTIKRSFAKNPQSA
ncbi:hypothetical protein T11_4528 [Trichinella zimbabwensis]|uniref:Uncharacterized protein n=1 Tax=Trichinella zimbabwensis TaxID=268475 RepID=A0A0V1H061_9BILA|nr:hypothetical protein T11_4528 [Trichinella zimbabwensis]